MSDGSHSNAVRLQAVALIAAAFVTTAGAVTSAFIQSGWIKKPAVVAMDVATAATRAQAKFTGAIEPVQEASLAVSARTFSTEIVGQTGTVPATFEDAAPRAKLQAIREPDLNSPAFAAAASVSIEPSHVAAPRVLPATTIAKPLMSTGGNWFSDVPKDLYTARATSNGSKHIEQLCEAEADELADDSLST